MLHTPLKGLLAGAQRDGEFFRAGFFEIPRMFDSWAEPSTKTDNEEALRATGSAAPSGPHRARQG